MNWPVWACSLVVLHLGVDHARSTDRQVWSEQPGFRAAPVQPLGSGQPGFTLVSPQETGVWFTNVLQGDAFLTNVVAHNGSGLALGDVNGDGWTDIYLCGLQSSNRLFRNVGNWRFEQVELGEAACAGQFSTGAALVDVDGDVDLDLLVNGIATGTRLFVNDGQGRFKESRDSGLSRTASATSLALADIDGDGDLDLYCPHYIDVMHLADPTTRFSVMMRNGRWVVLKVNDEPATLPKWKDRFEVLPGGRVRELPEVHGVYRNDGKGRFTAIEHEKGLYSDPDGKPLPPSRDWGLAAMFRDLNGDGAPDLYVCNDNASPDRIWINSGRGTFRAIGLLALRHTSRSSMGIDMADVNRDGRDDIFVLDMIAREHARRMRQLVRDHSPPEEFEQIGARPRYNRNMLFLQRADGSFAEVALMAGVPATGWTWCPIFLDVDLDGYEDLLVSNGFSFDVMDQDSNDQIRTLRMPRDQLQRSRQKHPSWFTPNAAFRNRRDGTFEPAAREWRFDLVGVSNGMALGDLDNDGDLDVVLNNLNGVTSLLRNDSSAPRVAVRLRGIAGNMQGIGARLTLVSGELTQSQEMMAGGRYMSCDQAMRVFALPGASSRAAKLEVRWRNGDQSVLTNVRPNHLYEVDQVRASQPVPVTTSARETPFFENASALLGHTHTDERFDDWSKQPLLSHRLSRLGPGLAWCDLNGDGWEDLVISSGRGGRLTALINREGTRFEALTNAPSIAADQGAVVSWPDGRGGQRLLTAVSSLEQPGGQPPRIAAFPANNLATPEYWPIGGTDPGPLALSDVDRDGDLDLFVGGHFTAGQYPAPVPSTLLINNEGALAPSPNWVGAAQSVGLVSGATFADLDNDGWPDLALAVDWGPVRVFRNEHGRFTDVTKAWGFAEATGRWMSIVAGDFDGNGALDLAAGNWGRNTAFEFYSPGPWRLFYSDWNRDGVVDIIEAAQSGTDWLPMRDRRALALAFPDLPSRFATHQAFGLATVQQILGEAFSQAAWVEAARLESAIFLNRGVRFEVTPLPPEAQRTPVFGINVADFDSDGIEDLFVAQNFFGTASEHSREDAGIGLWMRGDGKGGMKPLEGTVSGVTVWGEQRGSAVADFNHDGRVDLAVSQNNSATKLFVNRGGKQGLRVTLAGPAGNPNAVGAHLRLVYSGERMGPVRAVQGGSGYRSQDAAVQVLGFSEPPIALWIRWPGGKEARVPIAANTSELRLSFTQ
ncbi:MAG: VCBS repeat-containing protein [Verrucomicrobiia bacterium]